MNMRKAYKRRLRHRAPGIDMAADVNVTVAAHVNEPGGAHTRVSSRQEVGRPSPDETERSDRQPEEE